MFKSEIIDAFELGLKTDLMDGRMRANVSAFMYDYENNVLPQSFCNMFKHNYDVNKSLRTRQSNQFYVGKVKTNLVGRPLCTVF